MKQQMKYSFSDINSVEKALLIHIRLRSKSVPVQLVYIHIKQNKDKFGIFRNLTYILYYIIIMRNFIALV